jgi:hypothetical protein
MGTSLAKKSATKLVSEKLVVFLVRISKLMNDLELTFREMQQPALSSCHHARYSRVCPISDQATKSNSDTEQR